MLQVLQATQVQMGLQAPQGPQAQPGDVDSVAERLQCADDATASKNQRPSNVCVMRGVSAVRAHVTHTRAARACRVLVVAFTAEATRCAQAARLPRAASLMADRATECGTPAPSRGMSPGCSRAARAPG